MVMRNNNIKVSKNDLDKSKKVNSVMTVIYFIGIIMMLSSISGIIGVLGFIIVVLSIGWFRDFYEKFSRYRAQEIARITDEEILRLEERISALEKR